VTSNRITLVVEGLEQDGGDVRLEVFVEELQKLQAALARSDRTISGGKRNSYFAVVGLSHSSPATVELEARVDRHVSAVDVRAQAFHHFTSLIEAVEKDEVPPTVDYPLLEDLRALTASVGPKLRSARLRINDSAFVFTQQLTKRIDQHLATHEYCATTIEGMLEKINVHGDANAFTIYPDVGPARISCHFKPELADKAVSAIRNRVAVTGTAAYRKHAPYPHHIEVDDIEIFLPPTQLAKWEDLLGIAPDIIPEGQTAEGVVRELRNGWH
jgi:hypothetical protein